MACATARLARHALRKNAKLHDVDIAFEIAWLTGRGFGRWLFAAGALLAVSGVRRLIEYWITNGTGGVT